ncbi:MAG: hypothetical protein ACLUZZ_01190 [Alistipes inops]
MDILASLEIRRVSGSELPQRLLLAADESREAVADYVDRGWCYGAFLAGRMVGEYVLLHTRPFTAEVVNIAVEPAVQRQGIAVRCAMQRRLPVRPVSANSKSVRAPDRTDGSLYPVRFPNGG